MHVRTLGRAELSANGTRLGPEAKVAFPLLLHLVLERDHWVSRVQLQEMLFPEQDREHARHSLRQSVYVLRKDGFPIEGSGPALHIPAKGIVDDYSTLLTPQLEGERELAELMGGWLAGFEPTISKAYSHWFEGKRGEVALGMRSTLLTELAVHKRNARWGQCERTCRAILTLDPLNEEATLGLAEALALTGAKVQAIRILERYQEEMPNADLKLPARILKRRISEQPIEAPGSRVQALVGREAEMTAIHMALNAARSGDPSGIHLSGEPGLGKSRLLGEGERVAALAGFKTVALSCRPHDARRPLGIFTEAVPRLRTIPGALGCAPEAIRLLERLEVVPSAADRQDIVHLDSSHVSARVEWAVDELFESISSESALLITVDDVHWSDAASLSLLASLLRRPTRRLAIVLAGRDQQRFFADDLATSFRNISLSALSNTDARALFRAASGLTCPPDEEAIAWAECIGVGNPLYLITLARHLRDEPHSRTVPSELTQLLESRLASLAPTDAHVFAAVCALGRHATFHSLDKTLGIPSHQVMAALDRLDSRGFVAISADRVEPTHPLLAEGALRRMAPTARSYLHHAAARALGAEEEINDPTRAWDIVHLLSRSGATKHAANIARKVAGHALTIGRAPEACDLLTELHAALPISEERKALSEDLLLASRAAGRWTEVRQLADALLSAGNTAFVSPAELSFLRTEAQLHQEHKYEHLAPALSAFLSDPGLSAASRFHAAELLLIAAVNLNDATIAEASMRTVLSCASDEPETSFLSAAMIFEMSFGDMTKAESYARRLLAATESEPLTMQGIRRLCNAAAALFYSGSLEESLGSLRTAYERTVQFGFAWGACRCANEIANFLNLIGNVDEARAWVSTALSLLDANPNAFDKTLLSEHRFWFAVFDGDFASARTFASELAASSEGRSPRSFALSRAALALCDAQEATSSLRPLDVRAVVEGYLAHRGGLEAELWTWAVCEILRLSGDAQTARSLAAEYAVGARRERGPIRSALAHYLD